jgi:hypothetical protein
MPVRILPKCDVCGARGCKTEHTPTRKFTRKNDLYRNKKFHQYLNLSDEYVKSVENIIDGEHLNPLDSPRFNRDGRNLDEIENNPQDGDERDHEVE